MPPVLSALFLLSLAPVPLAPVTAAAQDAAARPMAAEAEVSLYDDLGDAGRAISTASPDAQTYFDQGLRLQYAFNHPEAIRSYRRRCGRNSSTPGSMRTRS